MIPFTIPNLDQHIAHFKNPDQQFIEQKTGRDGNFFMTYTQPIQQLLHDLKQANIELVFEWTKDTALFQNILKDTKKIAVADSLLLQKLFTFILRYERTNEGYLGTLATQGILAALLTRVKELTSSSYLSTSTKKVTPPKTKRIYSCFGIFLIFAGGLTLIWLSQSLTNDLASWKNASVISAANSLSAIPSGEKILVTGTFESLSPRPAQAQFDLYIKYLLVYDTANTNYGVKTRPVPSTWKLVESYLPDSQIRTNEQTILPLVFRESGYDISNPSLWLEREAKQTLDGNPAVIDLIDKTHKFNGFINGDTLTIFGHTTLLEDGTTAIFAERLCGTNANNCFDELQTNKTVAQIILGLVVFFGVLVLVFNKKKHPSV